MFVHFPLACSRPILHYHTHCTGCARGSKAANVARGRELLGITMAPEDVHSRISDESIHFFLLPIPKLAS